MSGIPDMGPSHTVLQGAAAERLREIDDGSIDQVYLDPPFGTQTEWTGKAGSFSDRFAWDAAARERLARFTEWSPPFGEIMASLPIASRDRAYLLWLTEILVELRRVLHPAGSIWVHCDDTMGAYIRLALDLTFAPAHFLGIVIWKRTTSHNMKTRGFGRVHDSIFVYARSKITLWRLATTRSGWVQGGMFIAAGVNGFSEASLNPTSRERVGYPTQKPVELLEQVIAAGSRPGGLILDPTCGSGTTLVAAMKLGRRSIGIDASAEACALARSRLGQGARPPTRPRPAQQATDSLPLFGRQP